MPLTPSILLLIISTQLRMSSGVFSYRLKKRAEASQSLILMYHRVITPSETDEYIEPGMYVTPTTFRMHLRLLTKYFDVVSLQKLLEMAGTPSSKPLCAITFDDGWYDFYTNAYPIIQEYKTPATVFLPTSYIGTKRWFWTDRLATILKNYTTSITKPPEDMFVATIAQLNGSLFSRIDTAIKMLKPHSLAKIEEVLSELELSSNHKNILQKPAFLDWYNCRTLKNSGLVSFGSHTENHIILTSENEQICSDELGNSKRKLIMEEVVEPAFIPFCYPNGGFSEKCAKIVENMGYHCGVTTQRGWVDAKSNNYTLNRIGMHQDISSRKAMMMARVCSR